MSDEDRSPLTDEEQRKVDRHLKRYPSADRAQIEDAMRRRRQHAEREAESARAVDELREKNAATLARSDLTPDERREAEIAAAEGQSAEIAVNTARRIKALQEPTPAAHGTNGTAADDALLNTSPESPPPATSADDYQVDDRQRERLRAEATAARKPKRTGKPKPEPEAPKVDAHPKGPPTGHEINRGGRTPDVRNCCRAWIFADRWEEEPAEQATRGDGTSHLGAHIEWIPWRKTAPKRWRCLGFVSSCWSLALRLRWRTLQEPPPAFS